MPRNGLIDPRIGFIGIGLMGLPLCRRLLDADFALTVWNRHPDKCEPLANVGSDSRLTSLATLAQDRRGSLFFCAYLTPKAVEADRVWPRHGLLDRIAARARSSSTYPRLTLTRYSATGRSLCKKKTRTGLMPRVWRRDRCRIRYAGHHGRGRCRYHRPRCVRCSVPLSQRVTHMGPSGAGTSHQNL
jgi:hypothetical protein